MVHELHIPDVLRGRELRRITWDDETGAQVLDALLGLTTRAGKTLVMATHSMEIVSLADRVCRIHDGKLQIASAK